LKSEVTSRAPLAASKTSGLSDVFMISLEIHAKLAKHWKDVNVTCHRASIGGALSPKQTLLKCGKWLECRFRIGGCSALLCHLR
jgi:hypothetical protein